MTATCKPAYKFILPLAENLEMELLRWLEALEKDLQKWLDPTQTVWDKKRPKRLTDIAVLYSIIWMMMLCSSAVKRRAKCSWLTFFRFTWLMKMIGPFDKARSWDDERKKVRFLIKDLRNACKKHK